MANKNLSAAKSAKNDEFYTQYADIDREMQAYFTYDANVFRGKTILLPCDDPDWSNFTKYFAENFELFGLKKLISTSYAFNSKKLSQACLPGFEKLTSDAIRQSPHYDKKKEREHGKIFILDEDTNKSGRIDIDDLKWEYLKGDGDFRSDEVKKLRDEADVIITNPPFSLFREFLAWILKPGDGGASDAKNAKDFDAKSTKKFAIIANQNAIKYKDTFPLFRENRMWLGATGFANDMVFAVPKGTEVPEAYKQKAAKLGYVGDFTRLGNTCWFTNIEHGRRHTPLMLMTKADNIKYSKHKEIHGVGYQRYVNYDAIHIPHTDAIPSDYDGVMGVPITFLDKYCPEQFELLGSSLELAHPMSDYAEKGTYQAGGPCLYLKQKDGPYEYHRCYDRLLIRARKVSHTEPRRHGDCESVGADALGRLRKKNEPQLLRASASPSSPR